MDGLESHPLRDHISMMNRRFPEKLVARLAHREADQNCPNKSLTSSPDRPLNAPTTPVSIWRLLRKIKTAI